SRNSGSYNDFRTKVDSNSIATRIRRNRERLPSCLLIENVSAIIFAAPSDIFAPRHFRSRLATIRQLSDLRLRSSGSALTPCMVPTSGCIEDGAGYRQLDLSAETKITPDSQLAAHPFGAFLQAG